MRSNLCAQKTQIIQINHEINNNKLLRSLPSILVKHFLFYYPYTCSWFELILAKKRLDEFWVVTLKILQSALRTLLNFRTNSSALLITMVLSEIPRDFFTEINLSHKKINLTWPLFHRQMTMPIQMLLNARELCLRKTLKALNSL